MEPRTRNVQVHLTGIPETLLITLNAKALDSRSKDSILHDEKADQMMQMIDYDFAKLKSFGNDNIIVVRAKEYDEWVRDFLKRNPQCIVLNLGCGLDTRVTRIHPPSTVSWFDVDYPEVIALRKNFYTDTPGYRMIESSLTDPAWLAEIPQVQSVMIVAEGVLEYLTEEEVKTLLNRLTEHFPHGEIAFDVMNSDAIQGAKADPNNTVGGLHKWEVNDLTQVDTMDPKLKRETAFSLFGAPHVADLPLGYRLLYGTMAHISRFGNMIRLLRYRF